MMDWWVSRSPTYLLTLAAVSVRDEEAGVLLYSADVKMRSRACLIVFSFHHYITTGGFIESKRCCTNT